MTAATSLARFAFAHPRLILIPWAALNLTSLIATFIDKRRAKQGGRRISEAALLYLALAAPVGAITGMHLFRHKTRKLKFRLLLPLFLALHVLLMSGMIYFSLA